MTTQPATLWPPRLGLPRRPCRHENALHQLREENARLRAMIEQMGDRILLMSQILTRRAERMGDVMSDNFFVKNTLYQLWVRRVKPSTHVGDWQMVGFFDDYRDADRERQHQNRWNDHETRVVQVRELLQYEEAKP